MREFYLSVVGRTEVVETWLEGVPHEAVAGGRPIEWGRGSHSSIYPVVGVDDFDFLTLVRESSVLYATTEEILIWLFAQAEGYLFGCKLCRSALLSHGLSVFQVDDLEELGSLVEDDLCLSGRNDDGVVLFLHIQLVY